VKPLVLVCCEFSGTVRRAFEAAGADAWSCDLLPTEAPGQHIQGDALVALRSRKWDLVIAHPPCQYLCSSGQHWTTRGLRDPQHTEDALAFVRAFMDCDCPRVAIENPVGVISTRIRKPDQIVQPYEYGHDASKRTCLWLRGLPKLKPTEYVPPRLVCKRCGAVSQVRDAEWCVSCALDRAWSLPRWANQTDSGQNKLGPSADRWALRSMTYPGIANAMASQWMAVLTTTNSTTKECHE
jgi:ribosomal protein L37E